MKNDYRNSNYCIALTNVEEKVLNFKKQILEERPRVTNLYKILRKKTSIEKRQFIALFNNKCVYCGNSINNIPIDSFEIDHYRPQSKNAEEINDILNLVPSCVTCNRGKSGINMTGNYLDKLKPSNNRISDIFVREDNYSIEIDKKYAQDGFIIKFYNQLKFGHEARRLDYLLLELRGLCELHKRNTLLYAKLSIIINTLNEKRNRFSI